MYALQSWLEVKGQVALMNARYDIPFIGIYPEVYRGNDLGADRVVRYILNTPGFMALYGQPSPTEFDETDDIYVFSKIYDTFGVHEDHLLFLPVINLFLFKDYGKRRTKTCYFVGKGKDEHKHPEDAILIDRKLAKDQSVLADVLNDCQVMYGYDPLSAMYDISRLCGCPVEYHGDQTREQLKDYEPGLDGIDFGEGTMFNSESFRDHYKQLREEFSLKLDRFIEDTQK